ncbi:MAG: hypothetical protein JW864_14975 [Spirochaetes bacterium]|nr:hypothetical protein [Spirochaetota bacterium]
MLKDISTDTDGSNPEDFTVYNRKLYFSADANNTDNNRELWVTDGSSSGTAMLKDIYEGPDDSFPFDY